MNKKFKFIFINNQSHESYGLSINILSGYIVMFLIMIVLFFASIGIYRFIKPHAKQEKMNIMYAYKYNTEDMLTDLKLNNLIDSNFVKKYNLQLEHLNLMPNNPPVSGVVTKGISSPNNVPHNGIDIAAKSNSEVRSAQEGMIIFSNFLNDYGNTIIIAHPNNYYTVYSHLNKSLFKERIYVSSNQIIGYVGQTGNSDAPHLHFEIWKNHHIIDPRNLIKEYRVNDVSIK